MEINYNSAAEIKAFLAKEGLGMRKKYGQNFLINPVMRNKLADALEADIGESVWEIGPGIGSMTKILLDKGLMVRAFEIDTGFIHILYQIFNGYKGFTLVEGDVMKTWQRQPEAPLLLGNLPYNIAARVIADMTEKERYFKRMVITVQRETAMRMIAKPGSPNYSSFSILCESVYTVKKIMDIKGSEFFPHPNIQSMGLRLDIRDNLIKYPVGFYPMVRQLFSFRRKMVKNNLVQYLEKIIKIDNKKTELLAKEILSENKLTGTERAEDLDIETFVKLAKTIDDLQK